MVSGLKMACLIGEFDGLTENKQERIGVTVNRRSMHIRMRCKSLIGTIEEMGNHSVRKAMILYWTVEILQMQL